jgi:hypothetical protein
LNDKIDLAQAEAIADLIDASTEAAARSASRSLTGAFSHEIHALRDALIHLRMLVEATLDFPEEEIDFLRKADARGQLSNLQQTLAQVRSVRSRARCCARASRWSLPASPTRARARCSTPWPGRAGHRHPHRRHHARQGAADHPDRRRAAAHDRHRRPARQR